jgi:hypothetical protein
MCTGLALTWCISDAHPRGRSTGPSSNRPNQPDLHPVSEPVWRNHPNQVVRDTRRCSRPLRPAGARRPRSVRGQVKWANSTLLVVSIGYGLSAPAWAGRAWESLGRGVPGRNTGTRIGPGRRCRSLLRAPRVSGITQVTRHAVGAPVEARLMALPWCLGLLEAALAASAARAGAERAQQ